MNTKTKSAKFALIASAVIASSAFADPVVIPKPKDLASGGQEAGRAVAVTQDYSLMGCYQMKTYNESSGGAYLFNNGTTTLVQEFILGPTANTYKQNGTSCTISDTRGARMGERVSMSDQWVAMDANYLGFQMSPVDPTGTCGVRTPTIFLAKKATSGSTPYGALNYSIAIPNLNEVSALAVGDTDLIFVAGSVYAYRFNGTSWVPNGTFTGSSSGYRSPLAIDGDKFIVGDKNTKTIKVYKKSGTTWSLLASYTGTKAGFGKAVDISGEDIIVASDSSTTFLNISGSSISFSQEDTQYAPTKVSISAEKAVAGGLSTSSLPTKLYQFNGLNWTNAGTIDDVDNQPVTDYSSDYFAEDLAMEGTSMLVGWKGFNAPSVNLVGAAIYDKFPLTGEYRIQSYWAWDWHINIQNNVLDAKTIDFSWDSARWTFEQAGDYYRIKNVEQPSKYLHVENGPLEAGSAPSHWWSAQWIISEVNLANSDDFYSKTYKIKNRWTGEYLNLENGILQVSPIQPGWLSANWVFKPAE